MEYLHQKDNEPPSHVACPLLDGEEIADYDCIENRDIADDFIKEQHLPEKYKQHPDWKTICKNCKWHYF
jgi:hypothetical protein